MNRYPSRRSATVRSFRASLGIVLIAIPFGRAGPSISPYLPGNRPSEHRKEEIGEVGVAAATAGAADAWARATAKKPRCFPSADAGDDSRRYMASTLGMISAARRFMSSSVFATGTSANGGQRSGIVSPASL